MATLSYCSLQQQRAIQDGRTGLRVSLQIFKEVAGDGWRGAGISVFNRLPNAIRVTRIEAVKPVRLRFARRQDDGTPSAPVIALDQDVTVREFHPPSTDNTRGIEFLIGPDGRTPLHPGQKVIVRVLIQELSDPPRQLPAVEPEAEVRWLARIFGTGTQRVSEVSD